LLFGALVRLESSKDITRGRFSSVVIVRGVVGAVGVTSDGKGSLDSALLSFLMRISCLTGIFYLMGISFFVTRFLTSGVEISGNVIGLALAIGALGN
jgi:hypothetical protein